jgi:hypothetical protein
MLIAYIIFIYAKGDKKKYLFKSGFQGVAVVYVNQVNGISIDNSNVVYDFKNSNVIAVKTKIPTGYYPLGFLKYFVIYENGQESKLKTTDKQVEEVKDESNIYLWEYYYTIGNCNGVEYETNIISTKSNLKKYLAERDKIVNSIVCNKATK